MSKNLFQDMVKVNSTRKNPSMENTIRLARSEKELPPRQEYEYQDPKIGKSNYGLWFVAFISVLFLFFALSYLFSKAHITIEPKSVDLTLSENLSASKEGGANLLAFDLMSISGEETRVVGGGEEKEVSKEAKGVVIIYNAFSSASQALDINTRLEGSNGKIYKTDERIVVPGMKNSIPGSVEVGIHGSSGGSEYNSEPLDFKIFGFKGTSKYEKFYARSKDTITGGMQGKFFVVSDDDKNKTLNELKVTLQAKLFQKASDQIPTGFVLFKDAGFLKIDNDFLNTGSAQGPEVPITIKGTFYGFIFDEKKLTEILTKKILPNYDGSSVHISNIKDLNFSLANKETISFKDADSIYFKLSGNPKIVWDVDVEKLTKDVLGKKKKDFSTILLEYPNINSANLVIQPIWRGSFPKQAEDIKISIGSMN